MDILAHLFTGGSLYASTPGVFDDHWYGPPGGSLTDAGVTIDKETAQKISAWYRGRDILATMLAMLPLQVMERLPDDGGSKPATDLPLWDVLHNEPNDAQDSFMWRRDKMYDLIDYGWTYDWILPSERGIVGKLDPILPANVRPVRTKSGPTRGQYVFHVRDEVTGQTTPHSQDEIFYLRGAGGKGILEYARSSLGTAAATEQYATRVYGTGVLASGYIETQGVLKHDAGRRMALSFLTKPGEWHLPKVLEQGSKFVESRMSPEDAQMLSSRQYGVDDIARWLGVPRLLLENSDPSFGNAEQFTQNFLDINMGGWFGLWEFGINRQLIMDRVRYFARINRKAIIRSNFKDLVEGHVQLVNAGIESVDEARSIEDMPKRGGKADELRDPQNITGKPIVPSSPNAPKRAEPSQKAQAIAVESAARVLRKEVAAVSGLAVKHASTGMIDAVHAFYRKHAPFVAETLQMSIEEAEAYCIGQRDQVLAGAWYTALEVWKRPEYAEGLAALALGEEEAA